MATGSSGRSNPASARHPFLRAIVLAELLLPWAVHADAPGSTDAVRGLPVAEQSSASQPKATPATRRGCSGRGLTTAHSRVPRAFLENQGQVDERVKLYLRSRRQTPL